MNLTDISSKRILDFKSNANSLINANDKGYLSDNYKEFLDYYAKISSEDNCVQVLTDDVSLPYLLRKPSCTQFYNPALILSGWNEKKFIDQIYKSKPSFILYSSPINILLDKNNMPNVNLFINNNYHFFNDFKGWKIYKKK